MECREEVSQFLEGRKIFVDSNEVDLEAGVEACCSSRRVEASVLKGDRVTPVVRIELLDPSYRHLLLDALAILCEWVSRARLSDLAYAVVSDSGRYAELRFLEVCISPCGLEEAKAIASLAMQSVEAKMRKLLIACGGCMKVVNLVATRGLDARIEPPRCGAKYVKVEKVLEALELENLVHDPSWARATCANPEELLSRARGVKRVVEAIEVPKSARPPKTFGRFEVMALLQAARYYLLTGDLDKAKSFGLNRAIFYAWAKYYGPRGRAWMAARASGARGGKGVPKAKPLEDEVPVSPRGWFEMDGKEQLPSDFDRNVGLKIEASIPMIVAWRRALAYVKRFPPEILRDPNKFFKYVYEPVRDSFLERVVANPIHSVPTEVEREVKRIASAERKSGAKPPVRRLTDFAKGDKGSGSNGG